MLRQAIQRENKLQISYCDAQGIISERIVWPFALGFFERVRVLLAWCELRQEIRHFRTDRIGEFLMLGVTLSASAPNAAEGVARTAGNYRGTLAITFSAAVIHSLLP